MMKYLILILTLVSLTAKAQEEGGGYEPLPPPKKYDGITQSMTLSPQPPAPPGQYRSMGWGGAGTLSPRGVIDEWEEFKPMQ